MKRRGHKRDRNKPLTKADLRKHERLLSKLRKQILTRMVFNYTFRTDGSGLWSKHEAKVSITHYSLLPCSRALGELRVYFDRRSWSVKKHGLIYTDKYFLTDLKLALTSEGYSPKALRGLHYSEQGMQGDDYVSFDAGEAFTVEYMSRLKPEVVFRVMSAEIERKNEVDRFWRRYYDGLKKRRRAKR